MKIKKNDIPESSSISYRYKGKVVGNNWERNLLARNEKWRGHSFLSLIWFRWTLFYIKVFMNSYSMDATRTQSLSKDYLL